MSLEDSKLQPNEYWDDEQMWSDIEEGLDQKNRRRIFIIIFLGLGIIGFGTVAYLGLKSESELGSYKHSTHKPSSVKIDHTKVHKTTPSENGLSHEFTDSTSRSVHTSLQKTIPQLQTQPSVLLHNNILKTETRDNTLTETNNGMHIKDKAIEHQQLLIENTISVELPLRQRAHKEPLLPILNYENSKTPKRGSVVDIPVDLATFKTKEYFTEESQNTLSSSSDKQIPDTRIQKLANKAVPLLLFERNLLDRSLFNATSQQVYSWAQPFKRPFYQISFASGWIFDSHTGDSDWSSRNRDNINSLYQLDIEISGARHMFKNLYFEAGLNISKQVYEFNAQQSQITTRIVQVDTAVVFTDPSIEPLSGQLTETTTRTTDYQVFNQFYQVSIPIRLAVLIENRNDQFYLSTGMAFNVFTDLNGYIALPDSGVIRFDDLDKRRNINLNRLELAIRYGKKINSSLSLTFGARYQWNVSDIYSLSQSNLNYSMQAHSISLQLGIMNTL